MTKEEAIDILTREIDEDLFIKTPYREQIHEALNIAIEDIKLQVPNEWETEKFNPSYFSYTEPKIVYICPNCNGVADDAYKYCPNCGKAKIKKEIKDL